MASTIRTGAATSVFVVITLIVFLVNKQSNGDPICNILSYSRMTDPLSLTRSADWICILPRPHLHSHHAL